LVNTKRSRACSAVRGLDSASDLVDVTALDRSIRVDLRYGGDQNVLGACAGR
jgi:D-alanyl-D-alanine dipeptidase